MTDDARAALAAAIRSLPSLPDPIDIEWNFIRERHRRLDLPDVCAAILAALDGWRLVPADTSLAYDTGFQDGLLEAAEIHRAAVPDDAQAALLCRTECTSGCHADDCAHHGHLSANAVPVDAERLRAALDELVKALLNPTPQPGSLGRALLVARAALAPAPSEP